MTAPSSIISDLSHLAPAAVPYSSAVPDSASTLLANLSLAATTAPSSIISDLGSLADIHAFLASGPITASHTHPAASATHAARADLHLAATTAPSSVISGITDLAADAQLSCQPSTHSAVQDRLIQHADAAATALIPAHLASAHTVSTASVTQPHAAMVMALNPAHSVPTDLIIQHADAAATAFIPAHLTSKPSAHTVFTKSVAQPHAALAAALNPAQAEPTASNAWSLAGGMAEPLTDSTSAAPGLAPESGQPQCLQPPSNAVDRDAAGAATVPGQGTGQIEAAASKNKARAATAVDYGEAGAAAVLGDDKPGAARASGSDTAGTAAATGTFSRGDDALSTLPAMLSGTVNVDRKAHPDVAEQAVTALTGSLRDVSGVTDLATAGRGVQLWDDVLQGESKAAEALSKAR